MTWQSGRQLASINKDGLSATFAYDANGHRTQKTVNGVTTNYYWVGDRLQYMATGDDMYVFFYDDKGTPYGVFTLIDGVQEHLFYLYNAQGDVIAIIDDYAERVVNYEYSAWGELLSVTGSKADTVGTLNPFRYRGYCYDTETGFYYLNSRYYDPTTQRFVNEDGILGANQDIIGYNIFTYCSNDPVNMHDSTGSRAVENDHRGAWIMVTNTGMLISCSRKETVISTIPANKYKPSTDLKYSAESIQQAFNNSPKGGDFDGAYGLQCVDLSNWFVNTYTTLKPTYGNGKDIAANLANTNGLATPSTVPIAMSIFSVDSGIKAFGASGGRYGHTGVVLSVDANNKTVTVIHTWNGLSGPNSVISTYPYPENGVTFTYIGDYLQ